MFMFLHFRQLYAKRFLFVWKYFARAIVATRGEVLIKEVQSFPYESYNERNL